ncbi:hypothetical protein BDY17DRAFT_173078 [Neohortaea acidophila]|uniref:Uncharacterized protein n=1 Tax=Neohortaea acidophila TaxID=245834 RepID=A0A6A6PPM9_9PEZI|nr:uncharacterized protein BDY17DRAFT_173078 [Neohortaea acidophila]KAF2481875.1 hypothetical protein BDY17DRAFT_173078 [Neohortaea acidophila]
MRKLRLIIVAFRVAPLLQPPLRILSTANTHPPTHTCSGDDAKSVVPKLIQASGSSAITMSDEEVTYPTLPPDLEAEIFGIAPPPPSTPAAPRRLAGTGSARNTNTTGVQDGINGSTTHDSSNTRGRKRVRFSSPLEMGPSSTEPSPAGRAPVYAAPDREDLEDGEIWEGEDVQQGFGFTSIQDELEMAGLQMEDEDEDDDEYLAELPAPFIENTASVAAEGGEGAEGGEEVKEAGKVVFSLYDITPSASAKKGKRPVFTSWFVIGRLLAGTAIIARAGANKYARVLAQFTIDLIGEELWEENLAVYVESPPEPGEQDAVGDLLEEARFELERIDHAQAACLRLLIDMMR